MNQSTRYTAVGVDIEAGDRIKKQIARLVSTTHTSRVLHKEGAFGGLFSLAGFAMEKPTLVSSVDGVGTKTKVAIEYGKHRGIGHDIVNHSINDILTCGAQPLFFLDYFACGKQNDAVVLELIEGMSEACKQAGMSLIGGETAQMPDVYAPDDYDLAGCIVGIVDEANILDGRSIKPGHVVWGLPSSGLHTNGYTLARKVLLSEAGYKLDQTPPELSQPIGDELLIPHRSYLQEIKNLQMSISISAIAHITGGGFEGNIQRVLPDQCQAVIDTSAWSPLPIFRLIQQCGSISNEEMYRVFNMGIGMVAVVAESDSSSVKKIAPEAIRIGRIREGEGVVLIFP